MSNIKDYIRQASIFTMNGLIDPRFTSEETQPERKEIKIKRTGFRFTNLYLLRFFTLSDSK